MKYIFVLTLFIICFTLMFTKTLEFLGLALFFVVNVMYSAMMAMDLSAFSSQVLGGHIADQSWWWVLMIAFIVGVVLVLNFTSSVLTMMTLGNLYYKFGAKGNPILLSPEYRVELNHVKGLFVSIIVLVTILALRMFLSPDKMSYGIFEWMKEIPDEISKYGHVALCLVVFGLMTTILHVITPSNQTIDKLPVPGFPDSFKSHFRNLFYVLMGIVLLYVAPSIMGGIGKMAFGESSVYAFMNKLYTGFNIPAFDVFVSIVSLGVLGLSSKLQTGDTKEYSTLSIIGIVFSVVLFFSVFMGNLFTYLAYSSSNMVKNMVIAVVSFVLLFTLAGLHSQMFTRIDVNNVSDSYIFSKIAVSLLMLFPLAAFIGIIKSYMTYCTNNDMLKVNGFSRIAKITGCIFEHMSSGFTLNLIEVFDILKGLLIILAFVFSGFTMSEYSKKVAGNDKYNMYHNKFKFDVVFGICMAFLMVILTTSFFNTDNFPLLLTMVIEYLAPVAVLILASYLVYYSNDLAKLSKQEVLNDVQKQRKAQREQPDLGDTTAPVVSKNIYNGTTTKI